jgi:hypothetical protein
VHGGHPVHVAGELAEAAAVLGVEELHPHAEPPAQPALPVIQDALLVGPRRELAAQRPPLPVELHRPVRGPDVQEAAVGVVAQAVRVAVEVVAGDGDVRRDHDVPHRVPEPHDVDVLGHIVIILLKVS